MNTDQKWFALTITADARAAEAVEFALNEMDALGTEIDNLGKTPAPKKLEIVGYFNEELEIDFTEYQINEALRIYDFDRSAVENYEWRAVENRDWLAEWKKSWRPTVTDRFIIAPVWETVEPSEKIVIRIEPSMAFGTGTHETTRLCLRAIEELYAGESFLDVGTGTGILAIAAAKLKSEVLNLKSEEEESNHQTSDFLACDTDEDSVKIARENAEINETGGIDFYVGSITDETAPFDFVCANLTADVIVPILPLLIEKSNKILVLSGILKEQESLIAAELSKLNVKDFQVRTDGEWISILMDKR